MRAQPIQSLECLVLQRNHPAAFLLTLRMRSARSDRRKEKVSVWALLSTQVDQLIQAMAGFTAQTGLTWDQAIDQRPQDVQTVLAVSWQ